jgi:hypothetical protein
MAKHQFLIGINEGSKTVGAQCVRCGKIALYTDGKMPEAIIAEECPQKDAAVVREPTEDKCRFSSAAHLSGEIPDDQNETEGRRDNQCEVRHNRAYARLRPAQRLVVMSC